MTHLRMLAISIHTFAKEWTYARLCLLYSQFFTSKECLCEPSGAVWETASHCELTVVWILLFRDGVPQLVSEGTLIVVACSCLQDSHFHTPHCWALHPARSHLERKGRPQLPLEVVSSVPQLASRGSGELTSSRSFFSCQEVDCTLFTTLSASTRSPNYRTNL